MKAMVTLIVLMHTDALAREVPINARIHTCRTLGTWSLFENLRTYFIYIPEVYFVNDIA